MDSQQQPLRPFAAAKEPRRLRRGLYVTFEGPDGCGKSTQLQLLARKLAEEGYPVVTTKQPGGTEVGAGIRSILLHPSYAGKIVAKTESMLFWADRTQHYETVILPGISAKQVLLGDRDFDSSWAYQHYGRGLPAAWMTQMQKASIGASKPHLTLLFDGPVKLFLERSMRKNVRLAQQDTSMDESRFEREAVAFHDRVRQGFLERAKTEPERFVVIDATKPIADIHKHVCGAVREWLVHQETDELYDVVDENGEPVGQATWFEVHKQGLLHMTADVLIFKDNTKQEVLLQKRGDHMDQMPGLLQHSAGGHIKRGDSPEEGIRNELQEELFYGKPLPDVSITHVSTFYQEDFPNNRELVHTFEMVYPGPFFPNPKEVQGMPKWVRWKDLLTDTKKYPKKYTPSFLLILSDYLQKTKKP